MNAARQCPNRTGARTPRPRGSLAEKLADEASALLCQSEDLSKFATGLDCRITGPTFIQIPATQK
jgi:hypothetical protein